MHKLNVYTQKIAAVLIITLLAGGNYLRAEEPGKVYPAAILTFSERGSGVQGYGQKISDILFTKLTDQPDLMLVEREDLEKSLREHELNLSGIIKPEEAVQAGNLVGARLFITGSVVETDKTIYIVAKIISTETSRVLGVSLKGRTAEELAPLVEELSHKIIEQIKTRASQIVAAEPKTEDYIASLTQKLGDARRPTIMVRIAERHIGQTALDPAAATEFMHISHSVGFKTLDAKSGAEEQTEILIEGEGFSEFAMRRGNLVCVKARLELKTIDRATGNLIAVDRQTGVEVDLAEHIAGKKALQKAAAVLAERLLPKISAYRASK